MVNTPSDPPTSPPVILPADLTIINWPLRDRPIETGGTLALALLVAVMADRTTSAGWWTPAFCLALATASWRMWMPVTIRIDHRGIEQRVARYRRLIPWSAVAFWRQHPRGVMLFARRDDIPLANLRGLYIDGGDHVAALANTVEFYVQPKMLSPDTTISFAE